MWCQNPTRNHQLHDPLHFVAMQAHVAAPPFSQSVYMWQTPPLCSSLCRSKAPSSYWSVNATLATETRGHECLSSPQSSYLWYLRVSTFTFSFIPHRLFGNSETKTTSEFGFWESNLCNSWNEAVDWSSDDEVLVLTTHSRVQNYPVRGCVSPFSPSAVVQARRQILTVVVLLSNFFNTF